MVFAWTLLEAAALSRPPADVAAAVSDSTFLRFISEATLRNMSATSSVAAAAAAADEAPKCAAVAGTAVVSSPVPSEPWTTGPDAASHFVPHGP